MDDKLVEATKESTSNSADICKETHPTVQQKDDEKFKPMNFVHPENNKDVSFIQASKGKRKYSCMFVEASNSEQSGNPSSVLSCSNSRCGGNSEKCVSFKDCSENFKREFRSETGLVKVHNTTSSTTGVITEQIIGESHVSSLIHTTSEEESEISSEVDKRYLFNEDTKDFLGSEEVIKNAGFGSKNIFYHPRSFPKSDISPKNKETGTISGMDYQDGQISSRLASPDCCGNEETEVNMAETLNTRDSATADGAGPSGIRQQNENGFSCNLCGKEFAESGEFDAHYRTHKAFVFNICQTKFTQKGHLEIHDRTHTREKLFVCNVCEWGFTQKVDLDRHYRTHTGEKPFVCDVCQRGFNRQHHLKTHYMIHTREKLFVCDVCEWRFTRKVDLDRHYRTHTGEKPYVCDVCQKGFALQKTLKIHYRIHTGEKPYVCDVCQKGFNRQHHLKTHYIIHTGEKPYVCDVCKREFTLKRNLERHSRSHTGEKPYVCDVCNERFAHQGYLKTHYRTHTGEKPFVCEICKKDFADNSNLAKHVRKHTGKKPYKCTIFGKSFSDSSSCKKHYKEKHN